MKVVIVIALIFTLAVGTLAYRKPRPNGKCQYLDLILSPGQQGKPKGKCENYICDKSLEGRVEPCDYNLIVLEPPCWWGEIEDVNKPFPDCCMRKVICPEEWPTY
ncbi:uncharacterized protein LOC142219662 [Haematobia irritans]|uniref:uncharacterized protein LOC142219662 n=1 Tax=Haematobia irritans TaxID=7368 RepID=UPI003F500F3C